MNPSPVLPKIETKISHQKREIQQPVRTEQGMKYMYQYNSQQNNITNKSQQLKSCNLLFFFTCSHPESSSPNVPFALQICAGFPTGNETETYFIRGKNILKDLELQTKHAIHLDNDVNMDTKNPPWSQGNFYSKPSFLGTMLIFGSILSICCDVCSSLLPKSQLEGNIVRRDNASTKEGHHC